MGTSPEAQLIPAGTVELRIGLRPSLHTPVRQENVPRRWCYRPHVSEHVQDLCDLAGNFETKGCLRGLTEVLQSL